MEAVEKSLTLRKDYAAGHLIRGLIYEKMGDKFKAIQDIRKAKELDPNDQRIKEHYDRLKN
jgi:Tfp pilus assembly protein PilF